MYIVCIVCIHSYYKGKVMCRGISLHIHGEHKTCLFRRGVLIEFINTYYKYEPNENEKMFSLGIFIFKEEYAWQICVVMQSASARRTRRFWNDSWILFKTVIPIEICSKRTAIARKRQWNIPMVGITSPIATTKSRRGMAFIISG